MKSISIPAVVLFLLIVAGITWLVWPTNLERALKAGQAGQYDEALTVLRPLASVGDPEAMVALAGMVMRGEGVPSDPISAMALYQGAAEAGHGGAAMELGGRYQEGRGVSRDLDKAIAWYDKALRLNAQPALQRLEDLASGGVPEAGHRLGLMFTEGQAVPKSMFEAAKWFRIAAEAGHGEALARLRDLAEGGGTDASYDMALMHMEGRGVNRDQARAAHWLTLAAKGGHAKAQFLLGAWYEQGRGVSQDVAQSNRWYRAAAKQGVVEAQYRLALWLRNNSGGLEDSREALTWFIKAMHGGQAQAPFNVLDFAREGDSKAQYEAGNLYRKGFGDVSADLTMAASWWRKAAEQGHVQAQFDLGFAFEEGQGVSRNGDEAARWYARSYTSGFTPAMPLIERLARAGHATAQYQYGVYLFEGGTPVDQDAPKDLVNLVAQWVRSWFHNPVQEGLFLILEAAEHGHMEAQFRAGRVYQSGKHVALNPTLARQWFEKAASSGHGKAKEALMRLDDEN